MPTKKTGDRRIVNRRKKIPTPVGVVVRPVTGESVPIYLRDGKILTSNTRALERRVSGDRRTVQVAPVGFVEVAGLGRVPIYLRKTGQFMGNTRKGIPQEAPIQKDKKRWNGKERRIKQIGVYHPNLDPRNTVSSGYIRMTREEFNQLKEKPKDYWNVLHTRGAILAFFNRRKRS